jgi:hypothetical protein
MRSAIRAFLLLGANLLGASLLAGCGDSQVGRAGGAVLSLVRPNTAPPITRAEADASPFASILVRVDGGRPAWVVLFGTTADRQTWLAADRSVIVTRHGRVVATANLPSGQLVDTWQGAPDPLAGPVDLLDGAATWRVVDLQPGDRFGFRLDCTLAVTARGPVEILERSFDLATVQERCRTSEGGTVTNTFWVDPRTGFVWKSDQWAGPGTRISIEVVKPYL